MRIQYIMLMCLCAHMRKLNLIIAMLVALVVAAGVVLVEILTK